MDELHVDMQQEQQVWGAMSRLLTDATLASILYCRRDRTWATYQSVRSTKEKPIIGQWWAPSPFDWQSFTHLFADAKGKRHQLITKWLISRRLPDASQSKATWHNDDQMTTFSQAEGTSDQQHTKREWCKVTDHRAHWVSGLLRSCRVTLKTSLLFPKISPSPIM